MDHRARLIGGKYAGFGGMQSHAHATNHRQQRAWTNDGMGEDAKMGDVAY